MSLFFLTFFLIYGGTHLYIFLKVRAAFHPGIWPCLILALFLLAMVMAPLLVRAVEREGYETAARVAANVGYIWMGFLFLFLTASLALDIYQGLVHITAYLSGRDLSRILLSRRLALALPLAWGIATALYGYFEAKDIRSERLVIETPKIPRALGRLTIVQVSDVHLGLIVRKERLSKIIDRIREASPDILVSTGDLVDGQINSMTGLAEMWDSVRPRFGKYAVTGNHEIYAGLRQALAFTERCGFRVLRGESAVAGGVINIVGEDDPAIRRVSREAPVPERSLLEGVDHGRFTLFLKHRPAVEEGSLGLFDMQLSGHVHKGQIFPFNLVTWLFFPVRTGYSLFSNGSALYVSRGTGTWGPPIRFLAPPEVTVIELRHGEKGE